MVTVNFPDLLEGFEFASFDNTLDSGAFICLETGTIHVMSSDLDEETPADLDDTTKYLAIPHKNDLDLGRALALSFVEEALPDDYDQAVGYFSRRGAYGRFKDLLQERGVIDQWYEYERNATEAALRQWCNENDIQIAG